MAKVRFAVGVAAVSNDPLRVAVLTNKIPDYRVPVFLPLSRDETISLKFFLSLPIGQSSKSARDAFSLHYSAGVGLAKTNRHKSVATELTNTYQVPIMLALDLLKFRPNLIISGEFGLRSVIAWLISKLCRCRLVLWSEEIGIMAANISLPQRWLRRFLLPRAHAFLAWGQPACDYLVANSVSAEKIYYCTQAVDNAYWMGRSRAADRDLIRRELAYSGKVFLVVSRMIPSKGLDLLVDAWLSVPTVVRKGSCLVIVGDGTCEEALRAQIKRGNGHDIQLAGAKEPEEVWKYYTAADCFVFPSLVDVWGLVVNEALACGLEVLASCYPGSTQEIAPMTTQIEVFNPRDLTQFTALLEQRMRGASRRDPEAARAAIAQFDSAVSTAAMERLIGNLFVTKANNAHVNRASE